MKNINVHKWGLSGAVAFAAIHAIWSVCVAISNTGMESFLRWILELHSIRVPLTVQPFNVLNAIVLIIVTALFGYLVGVCLGYATKYIHK